jgi:diaminohydroxyphosphoribosylaminopyrimidine deaminase/5-amino-6-(5-phosphoribosylamino)uracil reductase
VRADNPKLTVRGIRNARQPLRVVATRSGNIPPRSHLLRDRHADRTIVYRGKPLRTILSDLGRKNVTSVLIEGGGDVLGQALDEHLIDRLQCYIAPNLTGGPVMAFAGRGASSTVEAAYLSELRYEKIGTDICVTGYPRYGERARSDNLRNF